MIINSKEELRSMNKRLRQQQQQLYGGSPTNKKAKIGKKKLASNLRSKRHKRAHKNEASGHYMTTYQKYLLNTKDLSRRTINQKVKDISAHCH